MNTKELIKLAYKADIEGDLELADFIDRELLAISNNKNIREAALTDSLSKMGRGVGNFFGNNWEIALRANKIGHARRSIPPQ